MTILFSKNKRRFLRLTAYHLLKYKVCGDEKNKEGVLSFVRNISAGGVLFHSAEYIKPKSVLELNINFPSSPDAIKVNARVLRSKSMKIGGFDVAVEFLDLKDDYKNTINKRIANTFDKTREGVMKFVASIFIFLGVIAGIIAVSIKFNLIPAIFFSAIVWLNIVNTLLLFSMAISLITIRTNN
ncbi:MAG: PilZ domain-containing protein [Candidatus Omnitrophica bacterium]|jgi:hypothetical protein|nr:PilZ domain-containing protein [Candidatus Omnitrophota bacterium]